jgi:3-oxoadipate enol-lactonase
MVFDPDLMKNHLDAFDTKLTSEQFAAANNAFVGFDFRNDLAKVKSKTLVISGKYDGLNPPDNGREVASLIPNASFVEMQYSGHAPMYEESETYVEIISDFLLRP